MDERRLENYLGLLERALGPIAVSEKAEIITEIKSHLMDAVDSGKSLVDAIAELGQAEQVANRYLMERGLKTVPAAKYPVLKWLIWGFVACVGMVLVFTLILIWQFSPLVKVDDKKGQVVLLGGLIDVSDSDGIKIGEGKGFKLQFNDFAGVKEVEGIEKMKLTFSNGDIDLEKSEDGLFHYECEGIGKNELKIREKVILLDLSNAFATKCDLKIPAELNIDIHGLNGDIDVKELRSDLKLSLANGNVDFTPHAGAGYQFDVKITNGSSESFSDIAGEGNYQVDISLVNGKVELKK